MQIAAGCLQTHKTACRLITPLTVGGRWPVAGTWGGYKRCLVQRDQETRICQLCRRWLFASLACVWVWLAAAGWVQAEPLPQASFRVDIAPGAQGRISIGVPSPPAWRAPAPTPVYVHPPLVQYQHQQQPIYLAVPPKHAKKWHKHCHRYGACTRPVVLVPQPSRGGRPYPSGYWQTGDGNDYQAHKHDEKDKYRYKLRRGHGDGDGDDDN